MATEATVVPTGTVGAPVETAVVPVEALSTAHDAVTEPVVEPTTLPETTIEAEAEPEVKDIPAAAAEPTLPIQSEPVVVLAGGETSHVTTSGDVVRTQDPSARPDAKKSTKVKGDFKGAINGTIGSIQAAFGSMIRNKKMTQKGRDKMAAEDQRLGAKHGVMPVGSDLRESAVSENTTPAATTA